MTRVRISIIQSGEFGDAETNLERMAADVRAHRGSDLVVFPELALHGHAWTSGPPSAYDALRGVSDDKGSQLSELAAESGTSIVYGEIKEIEGRLYNLATYTNGRESVSYAKTHVHWSERFAPGHDYPVITTFARPLGMLICYDAAFTEVPRMLALRGAEIIVNVSAIPASFPLKHVHRRIVACSVQNQVFTIFANRSGEGYRGGSAVVDPTGELVALAGETGALTVDIDLGDVQRWRAEEPILPHRRPELYHSIAQ